MPGRLWWALVKLGFRLLYNELAWTYDLVSWIVSLGDWRQWQRAALRHLQVAPGARVLELAYGTGNLQIDLRTAGLESVGFDLSRQMGNITRRKLLRHRIEPVLVRGNAQRLPFPDEAFPAVVSTFPTEFIFEPATVSEVYRVLQPGGRLVVVASGYLTWGGPIKAALEWAYHVTGQRGPWPVTPLQIYLDAGFTLRQAVVDYPRSRAVVLIAEKTEISSGNHR